jgi:putative Mg2+ transporter-C (MgtC) family protein
MTETLTLQLDVPETLPALKDAAIKLVVAALLGGLVGLDRELRNKPLGLRTNMLMAIGSCAFALIVMDLVDMFRRADLGQIDPSRVIQGIIEGIGFLGTGAIIQSRGQVLGATTGASIWVVGAIGIACGFGLYLHAALLAFIAFFILTVLGFVERWFERRPRDD